MLVSILVPLYKVEKYLKRCLDSIFNQTYPEIEYVFVDDCSPDSSFHILNDYIEEHNIDKNKVTVISHQTNKGIAYTRNDLLNHAKGKYVLFIDSDDWAEDNMVEILVKASNNGTTEIIGCDYMKNFTNGKQTYHYEPYSDNCIENITRLINYNIGPTLWKYLIRTDLLRKVKIQTDTEIGEDYITIIMLFYYARNCSFVHQYLYHYTQYNVNRYSNNIEKSINSHIIAVNKVEDFLKAGNVYNQDIKFNLLMRKFGIKKYFLTPILFDCKKWEDTFPESNRMWRYTNYTKKEKFKFWLAENRLFFILRIINSFSHNKN